MHNAKGRVFGLLTAAFSAAAIPFFFMPVTLYAGNIAEFDVSLLAILVRLVVPMAIALTTAVVVGLFLPEREYAIYLSLLLCLAVLLWIQGDLLVWKYGLIDGRDIEWNTGRWRGIVDGALWVSLLILAVRYARRMAPLATFAGLTIIGLKIAALVGLGLSNPGLFAGATEQAETISPPPEIFRFSDSRNVLVLILDGLQSDMFAEIVAEDPDRWSRDLAGFTFFEDSAGLFPTTRMSVPAILSGRMYRNDTPMLDFTMEMAAGPNLPNMLHEAGFAVHLIPDNDWYYRKASYSEYYHIKVPYGGTREHHAWSATAWMLDLVGFRLAPHHLKRVVHAGGSWRFRQLATAEQSAESPTVSNALFFDDFIESSITSSSSPPTFKYLHLMTTHAPVVMDASCDYLSEQIPFTRENLCNQVRCGLSQAMRLLDRMRALGIYEGSLIIISADHGAGHARGNEVQIVGTPQSNPGAVPLKTLRDILPSAMPLLLVKPPGSTEPLQRSQAQVAISDIPDTVSAVMGLDHNFGGRSVFSVGEDEDRPRFFNHYVWRHENWQGNYFEHLDRYRVTGPLRRASSWQQLPSFDSPENYSPFLVIDLGTAEARAYELSGFGDDELSKSGETFVWALGQKAQLEIPIPKDGVTLFSARLLAPDSALPQQVEVLLDGEPIARWNLNKAWHFETRSTFIAPDAQRPSLSKIELHFSTHASAEGGVRPVSAAFSSVSLSQKSGSDNRTVDGGTIGAKRFHE